MWRFVLLSILKATHFTYPNYLWCYLFVLLNNFSFEWIITKQSTSEKVRHDTDFLSHHQKQHLATGFWSLGGVTHIPGSKTKKQTPGFKRRHSSVTHSELSLNDITPLHYYSIIPLQHCTTISGLVLFLPCKNCLLLCHVTE